MKTIEANLSDYKPGQIFCLGDEDGVYLLAEVSSSNKDLFSFYVTNGAWRGEIDILTSTMTIPATGAVRKVKCRRVLSLTEEEQSWWKTKCPSEVTPEEEDLIPY